MPLDPAFWRGRRVLLTGHTGFKGAWLALWLQRLGAEVTGLALDPPTEPALYTLAQVARGLAADQRVDLRHADAVHDAVHRANPEVVLHLAAQALVRPSYEAPVDTFSTNVMGTVHLLDALRTAPGVRAVLVVTTDKVYRSREWVYPYREDDALGGHDPYSASKAATEIVAASYRDAFLAPRGVALATARAGNVIGGGDWARDRLLPDAVRAWQAGVALQIRQPGSTRPWQHVLEPLRAYLVLAQALCERPDRVSPAYNFGPQPHEAVTVRHVVEMAARAYPGSEVCYQNNSNGPHESCFLALETAQARSALGLMPRWSVATAVQRTMDWYRGWAAGADPRALCAADLDAFEAARPEDICSA
ncbi:MAG: CDP-glucose 4,6-dehydratase [Burkholderiaceae bacterium]